MKKSDFNRQELIDYLVRCAGWPIRDDEISRVDVINAVHEQMYEYEESSTALRMLMNLIGSMPPVKLSAYRWIPCSERMPECEEEVLICTAPSKYRKSLVVPAIYEDGTMLENDSMWRWEDIDYAGWNEEEDCGIIPEGWWENRHFNLEEEYNHPIDVKVLAWMPLPKPYEVEE